MRTNIVIDDEIMKAVLSSGQFKTKREAVEAGLLLLIKLNAQSEIKKYRGKLNWTGNLTEMRKNKKR